MTETPNSTREKFCRRECIRFLATNSLDRCRCERNKNTERSTRASLSEKTANLSIAESICKCFNRKTIHSDVAIGPALCCSTSEPMTVEEDTNTCERPTDAHVESEETVDDTSSTKSTIERFIRLDYKDDPRQLCRKHWEMKSPNIFMSIISSGQDETKKSNVKEFCDNLVEAATQTNAWIITDGVMEDIDGIDEGKIQKSLNEKGKTSNAVLSICNWGCISDSNLSMKNNELKSHLVTHAICNVCGGSYEEKEDSVDRNHTTYVLVGNDLQSNPGLEKIFREKLEKELRKDQCKKEGFSSLKCRRSKEDSSTEDSKSNPLIYFLIGGDVNDIESVVRILTDENPVIVAKGTGGAADRIAKIVEQEEAEMGMDGELKPTSRDCLRKCNRELLVIYDCNARQDGSEDLSLCVRNALKVVDLIDATHGLTNDHFCGCDVNKGKHWEDFMREYLMKDQFSYVDILLSKKVKLENLLKRIMRLHQEIILNVGTEERTDHYFSKTLTPEQQNLLSTIMKSKIARRTCIFLWIWNDYRGQTEMANVFWRAGKYYLAMALMAYKISRDLKKEWKRKDEANSMADQKKKFKALATGFLSTCDKNSRRNTFALLRGPVKDLDDQTPMQIAFNCEFKEFVAQKSFQKLLDKLWAKRIIDYNKKFYFPLIVSIFIPFAASTLFEYHKDEKHKKMFQCPLQCLGRYVQNLDKQNLDKQNLDKQNLDKQNLDKQSTTMKSFLCFIRRFGSFLKAPLVKFIYNTLTYIAYLVLFSIVMLTDFQVNMSPSEIALTVWTFILIIEECRQAAIFRREFLSTWNLFDVLALILYVLGFILRLIYQTIPSICLECLYVARIVLCISLLLSVLRVLQLLSINSILGPKIYMIRRLLKDMLSFMLIITIFISAYGVVSNAILYPNQPLNAKLLQDVFYDAWWSFLQQFNTDDALGLNCNMEAPSPNVSVEYCSSRTNPYVDYVACKERRCPANTWIVSVLLAFYALFMVIMMLNVLIAMFNVTFTKVEAKQHRVSKMQRYRIIREYHFRSRIPAPLCVFVYLVHALCYLIHKSRCCTDAKDQKFWESSQNIFSRSLESSVTNWEENMLNTYEENARNLQDNTIAAIVPVSEDDDTGSVYNVVLNNPSYVTKQIDYTVVKIDSLMQKYFHIDPNGTDIIPTIPRSPPLPPILPTPPTHPITSIPPVGPTSPISPTTRIVPTSPIPPIPPIPPTSTKPPTPPIPPTPPTPGGFRHASTQTDDKKGCIYKDCCYEMNIQQVSDNHPRRGRRKKQVRIAVKAYPGRRYLKKTTCSTTSGCKMVINCKDGKVIKLNSPFADYGVPLKSSEFPAYRLPVENIRKIHCKCKNLSGGCVCDEGSTRGKTEISIRMPYGGVVIPPKAGDEKQILFDHKYHRGRSAPVTLNRSPPQALSVKQNDINKWMRPRGDTLTFVPSTSTNPEVSRGESLKRRRQMEDEK